MPAKSGFSVFHIRLYTQKIGFIEFKLEMTVYSRDKVPGVFTPSPCFFIAFPTWIDWVWLYWAFPTESSRIIEIYSAVEHVISKPWKLALQDDKDIDISSFISQWKDLCEFDMHFSMKGLGWVSRAEVL